MTEANLILPPLLTPPLRSHPPIVLVSHFADTAILLILFQPSTHLIFVIKFTSISDLNKDYMWNLVLKKSVCTPRLPETHRITSHFYLQMLLEPRQITALLLLCPPVVIR